MILKLTEKTVLYQIRVIRWRLKLVVYINRRMQFKRITAFVDSTMIVVNIDYKAKCLIEK